MPELVSSVQESRCVRNNMYIRMNFADCVFFLGASGQEAQSKGASPAVFCVVKSPACQMHFKAGDFDNGFGIAMLYILENIICLSGCMPCHLWEYLQGKLYFFLL